MIRCSLFIILLSLCSFQSTWAQLSPADPFEYDQDDLNIGGDIFSDFNEDLESAQIAEDERFYRYGRFFSLQVGVGLTTFDGNRGRAYENDPPTFALGVNYFSDFQNSYGLGFEYSKHSFFLDEETIGFTDGSGGESGPGSGIGKVDVNMLRVYFSFKHYIDTSDLGTAITYSNPYLIGRLEYWYVTNKFDDPNADNFSNTQDDTGGGLGFGLGFGLEFPVKLKETYIGTEFLWHNVNFHDKETRDYAPVSYGSGEGYEDLSGNVYSLMVSYIISW